MKKKLWLLVFMFALALFCAAGCASCESCGKGEEPHTVHIYNKKNTEDRYLKSEATCTRKAVYYFSCKCGETGEETFEYGELAEHDFKTFIPDDNATCDSEATETATCENCTAVYIKLIPDTRLPHDFGDYVSDDNATCTKNCTETATCKNCGETDTRDIADTKIPHDFVNYVSDENGTCQKNCTETATCENCEETDVRDIPDSKTGHTFINYENNNDATCTKDATETATCEYCTETDTRDVADSMLPHSFPLYVSDNNATCSRNCTETSFCTVCNTKDTRDIPDTRLQHAFETYIPDDNGTCIKNSTETAKCEFCNATDSREIPDTTTDHIFITYVSDENGTCTTNCTETAVCENCTATDSREIPDSRAHTYVNYVCSNCGSRYETQGLEYTLNGDEAGYTLTGKGKATDTEIYIPAKYNGLPVTGIDIGAFVGLPLEKLFIPAGVTDITVLAFSVCSSLTDITVDENNNNYKSIDGNLYSKDGTELIQYSASKKDASFEIPDGVTVIGAVALQNSRLLESISIPDSVTSIGEKALTGCGLLKEITVGENNPNYKSIDGNLYSKDGSVLIQYPTGKEEALFEIPAGVTAIGEYAFNNCISLISIKIPAGVTAIGDGAFSYCRNLTNIKIPDSVTDIGERAFYDCLSLTEIAIPDGVGEIGDWAFFGCNGLESIIIPDSVVSIGKYAFNNCNSLDSVYYCGTEAQWNNIVILFGNFGLNSATVYYYSATTPSADGNYWYYSGDEIVVW